LCEIFLGRRDVFYVLSTFFFLSFFPHSFVFSCLSCYLLSYYCCRCFSSTTCSTTAALLLLLKRIASAVTEFFFVQSEVHRLLLLLSSSFSSSFFVFFFFTISFLFCFCNIICLIILHTCFSHYLQCNKLVLFHQHQDIHLNIHQ